MTTQQAITLLDNLRKSVASVRTQNGDIALTGADHDNLREAINVLRCEHPEKSPESPATPPAEPAKT
jgi:hypothetical protein